MTQEIIEFKTDFYYIKADKSLNLIHIRPMGFWSSDDDISDYLPTIRDLLDNELSPGFNVICDLAQMKSASKDIRDNIHAQAGYEVMKRKVGTTVIVSPQSAITKMQINSLLKVAAAGRPVKEVSSAEEAYEFIRNRS